MLEDFFGKNVLLLQGPVGPFFWRLSKDLKFYSAKVYKVNFNLGDWFFYPYKAFLYKGDMKVWPSYFEGICQTHKITHVILFGDCRPIHRSIHTIAKAHNIRIYVFEEGYIRPNYVTFEKQGVNNNSQLPRTSTYYKKYPIESIGVKKVGNSYYRMALYGFLYHLFLWLGRFLFRKYEHHRKINFLSLFPWLLSAYRYVLYKVKERGIYESLSTIHTKKFFLVPLQVYSDSQIREHSDIGSIYYFIEIVIKSFSANSAEDDVLVIKHHSMDRGHVNYKPHIEYLISRYFLHERVFYIHDQNLPNLLNHAKGVIVVNSTVGLSAVMHKLPTKVLGRAIYDIEGLTYQGKLDDFWMESRKAQPDTDLVDRFVSYIIQKTQINGSFYKRLKSAAYKSGLMWQLMLFELASSESASYSDFIIF